MAHPLLENTPGKKHLLLGNEAIVRGALEGGVSFVSCYPGTPSSEVPDTFYRMSDQGDYYFEYSSNEKVALEVAGGAAVAGAASLVTMKHVGVNVAADPLMTLSYIGTPGGLVLLSADDPGCHSSQNEQDNRYYARLAGIPCFEPATAQEAKDMTRDALKLSRAYSLPVLLRTTTRVNHLRGPVEFGEYAGPAANAPYQKNPKQFVPIPAHSRQQHVALLEKMAKLREESDSSSWNTLQGEGDRVIVASGIARAYLNDALAELGGIDNLRIFNLGMSYPLPEEQLTALMKKAKKLLVLEELEPIVERELRALAKLKGFEVEIYGKLNEEGPAHEVAAFLPRNGEYDVRQIVNALRLYCMGEEPEEPECCSVEEGLPTRPPNLCAGCAHRSIYYAVRQVIGDDAHYSSDIGCYTLGILPPLSTADFLLCMGSSVSAGSGFAKASGQPVVAFVGDSTFFHSGIPGLVNAVYNGHNVLLVVLDNFTTAMTGHQPHPGVPTTAFGENPRRIDIETVVKGLGVETVRKVKGFNLKALTETLQELKSMSGVRVLIAEDPCALFARRTLKHKPKTVAYVVEQGEDVERCLEQLACPAFYRKDDVVAIDENLCTGCMVCVQVTDSIKARKRSS